MKALLAMLDLGRRQAVGDRDPIRHWHRGRVVLLGDAAHPTPQSLAQGACMAIEGGLCLADCLAAADGDYEAAFRCYERARSVRTARVTLESRYIWDVYHSDGIARDVYWQMLRERSEADTFRCLAWLYDGFTLPPAQRSALRSLVKTLDGLRELGAIGGSRADGSDGEDCRCGMRLSHFRANSVAISLILATAAVAVLSAALWAARAASRLRTLSNASIGVLGFTMRCFLSLRLGEMGCVFSRVNTRRRSMSPHSKHSSVWCSKPGAGMLPSCTTCVTYISAAHIKHRIATAPFQRGMRRTHPSCVSFEDVQASVASRQAAPPLSHV